MNARTMAVWVLIGTSFLGCGSDDGSGPGSADASTSSDGAGDDGAVDGGPTGAVYVVDSVERLSEDPAGCAPDATGEGNPVYIDIKEATITFQTAAYKNECARTEATYECAPNEYTYTWAASAQTTNWEAEGEIGDDTVIDTTVATFTCTGPECEAAGEMLGIIFPCSATTRRTYTLQ